MRSQIYQLCSVRTLRYIPQYTYNDYYHWEGNWELIDGLPVSLNPSPVVKHQLAIGNLFVVFQSAEELRRKKYLAYPSIDWVLKEDMVLRPDFLIAYDRVDKNYLDIAPVLVAEVLAPSTVIKDREAKYQIYESQKVKYYLILDADNEKIEIYKLIDDQFQLAAVNPDTFEFNLREDYSTVIPFDKFWR
jgi:Uma2 family endonuclease